MLLWDHVNGMGSTKRFHKCLSLKYSENRSILATAENFKSFCKGDQSGYIQLDMQITQFLNLNRVICQRMLKKIGQAQIFSDSELLTLTMLKYICMETNVIFFQF